MALWLVLLFFADPFEAAFRAGVLALNQNDLPQAETQLEAASRVQPRNPRVWLALAQTYWKLRKLPASQEAARKAETFSPDPVVLHGLSVYHEQMANYGKAAELEARYAETAPDAAPRALQLYLQAGQFPAAIELGRKSSTARPSAELHNLLGKAYEANGDPAGAVAEYRAAVEMNRFSEEYYFDLAQVLLKQQKFAAALESLDAARKFFDKSAQLELAAGVTYYGLRRFPEAIDAFLRTIALDPRVEQPYVFLGRMLDQAEDRLPRITGVFATFARTAPDNFLSSFLYGKALSLAEPDRAQSLLRKSIAQNSGFWESHFELGVLLDQQGKFEEAAREIRRSVELKPDDPAPHYRLARLYDRLGKTAEARAERALHGKLSAGGSGMAGIK
jgi:tetratricopeptide (TPR) repeat protein